MILYHGSFALLDLFTGFSIDIVQRIWVISIFAIQGLGMYYLVSNIVGGRGSKFAAVISGVFYIYNPWTIALMNSGAVGIYNIVLAMTPVFLAFFIKGINAKNGQMKYILALGLISLTQIFGIQLFVDQMLIIVFYFLFYTAVKPSKEKLIRSLRFAIITIVVILVLNLWWIIPSIASYTWIYTQQVGNIINRGIGNVGYLNVFRVWGLSWPFAEYYNSVAGIFIGLFLAAFAYVSLFLGNIKTKLYHYILFFALLSIIFTIFSAGNIFPFGPLYKWAFSSLPFGVVIFPQDTSKWLADLVLPYSFLIGVGSVVIIERIWQLSRTIKFKKVLTRIVQISLIVLVLVNANGLLSGNLNGILTPVKLPDYYNPTYNWLGSDPTPFRFYVVPSPYIQYQTKYAWAPYTMVDPLSQMPKPMVSDHPDSALSGAEIVRLVQNDIDENGSHTAKILGLMGVKYVLVRTDLDPSYGHHAVFDYDAIKKNLLNSGDFIEGPIFGAWTFYENKWFSPLIFPAQNSFSVVGNVSALLPLAGMNYLDLNSSAVFFLNDLSISNADRALGLSNFVLIDQSNITEPLKAEILNSNVPMVYSIDSETQTDILKGGRYLVLPESNQSEVFTDNAVSYDLSHTPVITLTAGSHNFTVDGGQALLIYQNSNDEQITNVFQKQLNATTGFTEINPTLYKVNVNASSPFVLTFSNSYAPMWKLYLDGKELSPFEVNSFANGYFIDKVGSYGLTIEYVPQRYENIGALVSILSAIVILSVVTFIVIRKRVSKKTKKDSGRLLY